MQMLNAYSMVSANEETDQGNLTTFVTMTDEEIDRVIPFTIKAEDETEEHYTLKLKHLIILNIIIINDMSKIIK